MIFGKLIGGLLGMLLGAVLGSSLFGFCLGVYLGHKFDKGLSTIFEQGGVWQFGFNQTHSQSQQVFFDISFAVMGHVAKADGVVSKNEIAVAEKMMQQLNLGVVAKKAAIESFNKGKLPGFDLDAACIQLRQVCGMNPILIKLFLDWQLQAAQADGPMGPKKQKVFARIYQNLGISSSGYSSYQQHQAGSFEQPVSASDYELLEVKSTATDAEVKKAYKKQMAAHHPDKLVAKGLPEEMVQVATRKTQEIQAAYKRIKSKRGMK
jgi:DnaJ like chaperone protein